MDPVEVLTMPIRRRISRERRLAIYTQAPGRADDLFIACASFEPRCLGAVHSLTSSYAALVSSVFRFLPSANDADGFEKARDRHTAALMDALTPRTQDGRPELILCRRNHPSDGVDQLRALIERRCSRPLRSITIDMSTFTKLYFLEVMNTLLDLPEHPHLRVLYSKASVFPRKDLTVGASDPIVLPRYLGQYSPSRRTALLGFVGFEPERAIRIFEEYEPDSADVFVTESDNPSYNERARRTNQYLLTRPGVHKWFVPAYDLRAAVGALEKARDTRSKECGGDVNLVLMSLGTKVHNLAVGLFCRRHVEARLAYAFAGAYQSSTDRPAGETLTFEVPEGA